MWRIRNPPTFPFTPNPTSDLEIMKFKAMKDFVGGNKKLVPHMNSDHCGARSKFLLEHIIGSMKGGWGVAH